MLWACILLPQLAIDAALRDGRDPASAFALIDGPAQQRQVICVSAAAEAAGIRIGHSLASAQALLPSLQTATMDANAIETLRSSIASIAYACSERVSLREPDAVLLEIGASLRYFGGWPRIAKILRGHLQQLNVQHRLGVASTPLAAVLAADHDGRIVDADGLQALLRNLPLSHARLDAAQVDALQSMGLRRLGELLTLPRAGLARRFGACLLDHLDRLSGRRTDPIENWQPAAHFSTCTEFDAELHASSAILFPLRRQLEQLAAFLACRDGGAQQFEIHLLHHRREATRLCIGSAAAERDAQRLFELARLKLDRVALDHPITGMRVLARHLPPFVPFRGDLFERTATALTLWHTLSDRLHARLGEEVLSTPVAQADHRPEKAWTAESSAQARHIDCGPRPCWLLPRPIPLRDRAPRVLSGPERIESGWWDGDQAGRDYYVLETSLGQRAWAFRPAGCVDGPWLLHGWFA